MSLLNRFRFLLFAIFIVISPEAFAQTEIVAPTRKPYVAYAKFIERAQVELGTGAVWMMDKGDCFPIYMFKNQQKKIILRLGDTFFSTETRRISVVPDADANAAEASYQKSLASLPKKPSPKKK